MLPIDDILVNILVIFILSGFAFWEGLVYIRKNDEDTEYTKNVRLSKKAKIGLCLFFYKEDIVEMEVVIHHILLYVLIIILSIVSLYTRINIKNLAIIYISESLGVWVGCMIYRFKTDNWKDSNDHYE
jgi:hypothetical protein